MNGDEKRDQSVRSGPDAAQERDDDFGGWLADHYGSMSAEAVTQTEDTNDDPD